MDELDKISDKLEHIEQTFGTWGVFGAIILGIVLVGMWIYFKTSIKNIAKSTADESLKVFQSHLDQELVKFTTKHQKQIDAVQDCYKQFQELHSFIDFVIKGEKFTAQMNPTEEVEHLTKFRLEFKRSYRRNKILFTKQLNEKIESLFPEIDTFIQDYMDGLMPNMNQDHVPEEQRSQYQIAGIWPAGKLEPTLKKMDEIGKEIEKEFRKIYGTEH